MSMWARIKRAKIKTIMLAIVLLLIGAYLAYISANSGYWQIKKDSSNFKVPADWEKFTNPDSKESNMGFLGIRWCPLLDDGSNTGLPCSPYQNNWYKLSSEPRDLENLFKEVATNNGYTTGIKSPKCNYSINESYTSPKGRLYEPHCTFTSYKGSVKLYQKFTAKRDGTFEMLEFFSGSDTLTQTTPLVVPGK